MDPLHRQAIVQGAFGTLLFVVLIVWPAGTFDYWQGWLFLGIFAASTVGFTVPERTGTERGTGVAEP